MDTTANLLGSAIMLSARLAAGGTAQTSFDFDWIYSYIAAAVLEDGAGRDSGNQHASYLPPPRASPASRVPPTDT